MLYKQELVLIIVLYILKVPLFLFNVKFFLSNIICRVHVLSTNTRSYILYYNLVIILDGSTDDMAVLNMSLSSRCLSEDMTDRGSTAPCWVVMLYSLSAESSLCLDFRFFSGLDHDLVEYGMANLKLLKRWNNRSYDLRYRITDYDIICSIFTIWVILCTFCIYTTNKDLLYEWEMNCYKHDK